MLIHQAPADPNARTVVGLWQFKNKEKHTDGITLDELFALGRKLSDGHLGFAGNLYYIYAGLSEEGELAFKFGYEPGLTEAGLSMDDLQVQFTEYFTKHTSVYLGFVSLRDETPEPEVEIGPLPRHVGYWNNLPRAVYSNSDEIDGNEVLNAWGLKAWGRNLPSDTGDYVGWQRVGLPTGWTIRLEGHDFYLLDDYNQVRGVIQEAFERPKRTPIVVNLSDNALYGDIPPEEIEEEKRKRREFSETKPRLVLRTCIRVRDSCSPGENGPYDMWVENAAEERLFGIYRQPVSADEYEEMMPKLMQRIDDWLAKNYPEWEDHNAYWDEFPNAHTAFAETKRAAYAVAAEILAGKTDEEMHALRAEIGIGLQRTDYTLALQERLGAKFGQQLPYRAAEAVVQKMLNIFNLRIGALDD